MTISPITVTRTRMPMQTLPPRPERTEPAPAGLQALPLAPGPAVLALGAGLKNTVCAAAGGQAFLSAALGNLDQPEACLAHEAAVQALWRWLADQGQPAQAVAHDLHPDFHSTRLAQALAARHSLPCLPVQHHQAHLAAVCAEHSWDGPVLGLALDGSGLGSDQQPWGGELMLRQRGAWQRLGHLWPLPLPGADKAAQEPWRMALALWHALGRSIDAAHWCAHPVAAQALWRLLEQGYPWPRSSALGRWFDAAAALLALCTGVQAEAEAARALEAAAQTHGPVPVPRQAWRIGPDRVLDLRPLLEQVADAGSPGLGAALFHAGLAAALADWLVRAARPLQVDTVAVGGGCWHNRLLAHELRRHARAAGLRLLEPVQLPPGDAAIAYGQAALARHLLGAH